MKSGEVFNDMLTFPLHGSSVQSAQKMDERIQSIMDEYLEDLRNNYPEELGFEVKASRDYAARAIIGDPWPVN